MHLGRKHDYLGVDMEFCKDGALEVSMFKYLKGVIDEFPEVITGRAATPAHDKLFEIRDEKEARKLSEEQSLAFHHTVAQLRFMATRSRRDIQTAVAFLTSRVRSPEIQRSPYILRNHYYPHIYIDSVVLSLKSIVGTT
jgi:hypothetical protein